MVTTAALLIGSYILGSIPFGLLIVKAMRGVDIRDYGSGNIGATNVWRIAGKGPAIVVFIADVLKGTVPVFVGRLVAPQGEWMPVLAGLLALTGHTTSIFLKFKGGKGVATGLGIFIGMNPVVAVIAFAIWGVLLGITRYVSLASIIAAISIPVQLFIRNAPIPQEGLAVLAAAYICIKHRSNMVRIAKGAEPKVGQKAKQAEEGTSDAS